MPSWSCLGTVTASRALLRDRVAAVSMDIIDTLGDMALSASEAAAILGVQFSRPPRMLERGEIRGRVCGSAYANKESQAALRQKHLFSLLECDRNYREYAATVERGNVAGGRRREYVHMRQPMLEQLAKASVKVTFADAINAQEAAELLDCSISLIPYLVTHAKLLCRCPENPRTKEPKKRIFIISRASCEAYRNTNESQGVLGRHQGGAVETATKSQPSSERTGTYEQLLRAAMEGGTIVVARRITQRDPRIIKRKKRLVFEQTGALCCEACGFDFEQAYGPRGRGFAHCHHKEQLGARGKGITNLDDLVILCANCHAMIERHQHSLLSVEELRSIVDRHRNLAGDR